MIPTTKQNRRRYNDNTVILEINLVHIGFDNRCTEYIYHVVKEFIDNIISYSTFIHGFCEPSPPP